MLSVTVSAKMKFASKICPSTSSSMHIVSKCKLASAPPAALCAAGMDQQQSHRGIRRSMQDQNKAVKVKPPEILTTVEEFLIRLVLTMSSAITGQLVINAFTIATLKLRVDVASGILSYK